MSGNAPCMNCDSRYLGCHSKCEMYESYIETRKAANKIRAEHYAHEKGFIEHNDRLSNKIKRCSIKSGKIFRSPKK